MYLIAENISTGNNTFILIFSDKITLFKIIGKNV